MEPLEQLIASVLSISAEQITDELAFDSIPEWDSLNHVNLMLALESGYGVEIDEDTMVELASVAAIRLFVGRNGSGP